MIVKTKIQALQNRKKEAKYQATLGLVISARVRGSGDGSSNNSDGRSEVDGHEQKGSGQHHGRQLAGWLQWRGRD